MMAKKSKKEHEECDCMSSHSFQAQNRLLLYICKLFQIVTNEICTFATTS